jgi:hypothetical protein
MSQLLPDRESRPEAGLRVSARLDCGEALSVGSGQTVPCTTWRVMMSPRTEEKNGQL